MTETILRLPAVKARTGLSRSTLYLLMARGKFPQSIRLGEHAVGWSESEVSGWINERIAQSRLERTSAPVAQPAA